MSTGCDIIAGAFLAREVERVVAPLGYHCGITGSVLYAGHSGNDLDIFLYQHDESQPSRKAEVMGALRAAGFGNQYQTTEEYVEKDVVMTRHAGGTRVDFFFVNGRRA
jgi:hypothetical protein